MENKIMRATNKAILIGLGLMVAACGTENRGLESVHQPVVTRTDYVLDVGAAGDGLARGDLERLRGWFDSLRLGYGDKVSIDAPTGGTAATREAITAIAARYGLLVSDTAPLTSGQIAPSDVRVVVSRTKAEVPNCPDWSRPSTPNLNEHSSSNFGCAINTNLAAMVANPEDLIQGHIGSSSVDASTSNKAIKSYRDKVPTGEAGLKTESVGGK
jgi:pilus assembly protein CpaD